MEVLEKNKITSKTILITPQLAEEWLLTMDKIQRPLKKSHVNFLAREMSNGKWGLTGESIKFSEDGTLIDGQHRLHAVKQSGESVRMLVVNGIKVDNYHKMDSGINRSSGDTLSAYGYKNSVTLASVAKFVISYEMAERLNRKNIVRLKISNDDVINWVKTSGITNRDLLEAQAASKEFRAIRKVEMAALRYIYRKINKEKADKFWTCLSTGLGLDRKSPVYILRNRLIKDLASLEKLRGEYRVALINKTWNAFNAGTELGVLKYDRKRELFPFAK